MLQVEIPAGPVEVRSSLQAFLFFAQFYGTRKNGLARITGAIMRSMYLKWLCARK